MITEDAAGIAGQKGVPQEGVTLSHRVVEPYFQAGRTFLQRLTDLSMTVKKLDKMVRLSVAVCFDLEWWREVEWHGHDDSGKRGCPDWEISMTQKLGVWSSVAEGMVPGVVGLAAGHSRTEYHHQRPAPHSDSSGHVGRVGRQDSKSKVRQHVSGSSCEFQIKQGAGCHGVWKNWVGWKCLPNWWGLGGTGKSLPSKGCGPKSVARAEGSTYLRLQTLTRTGLGRETGKEVKEVYRLIRQYPVNSELGTILK